MVILILIQILFYHKMLQKWFTVNSKNNLNDLFTRNYVLQNIYVIT